MYAYAHLERKLRKLPFTALTTLCTLGEPMAIYAIKKGEESNDRLQQRFKQQVQKVGLVKKMRARNIFTRKPSTRLQRIRALKREGFRNVNRKKKFYSNM